MTENPRDAGIISRLSSEHDRDALIAARAQLLFRNLPVILIANVVTGSFVLYAFWRDGSALALSAWGASLLAVQFVHLLLYLHARRTGFTKDPRLLVKLSIAVALLTGALWGASVLFLMSGYSLLHHGLLLFVIAGLTAATVASSSAYASVSLAFNAPATVPLALYFFFGLTDAGNIHIHMGVIVTLFTAFLAILAQNDEESTILSITLRLKNAQYVTALTTERDKARAAYESIQGVLDNLSQGVVVYDADLRLRAWSRSFVDLLHLPEHWPQVGRELEELISLNAKRGEYGVGEPHEITAERMASLADRTRDGIRPHRYERVRPDGTTIEIVGNPLPDGGLVATYTDITQHKKSANRAVEHAARHDGLTGLPNRLQLLIKLRECLIEAHRDNHLVSIIVLGLERLQDVANSMGPTVGDEVLRTMARRLEKLCQKGDIVARLDSQEFAIVATGCSHVADTFRLTRALLAAIAKPVTIAGNNVALTANAGISLYPNDSGNANQLIHFATIALNVAKIEGSANFRLYNAKTHVKLRERATLENDMRMATEKGDFELYYQPLLNTASGETIAVEALMRWQHLERGWISPVEFIPVAETSGLILPLTEWAIWQACNQVREWEKQGLAPLAVAVNLSPVHFADSGLVELVASTLEKSGLAPDRLELEITEGMILPDNKQVMSIMQELSAIGVKLVVDDFGTGYSSMSYLRQFPIDKLKIDRSFVRDVLKGRGDDAIVEALVTLAAGLEIEVIAEGIETEEQFAYLRGLGCDQVQGFLFTAPLPPDRFASWLNSNQWSAGGSSAMAAAV